MIQTIHGGLFFVIQNLDVENIIIGYQYEETEYFTEFLNIANNKNINIIVVKNDDIVRIDECTYFEIFSPFKDEMIDENAINNNSIVAKLVFLEKKKDSSKSILFTGDIEAKAEDKLVSKYGDKLKSDILKVAHHGAETSSSNAFLEAVAPKIALIGVGKDNSYGHPAESTIKNLKNIGAKIYRTDQNGEIEINLTKNNFKIKIYEK